MSYWMDIRFRPRGGGVWYPDEFRKFLASQMPRKPRLFWRDEQGEPMQGKPSINFIGGRRWVGIRATWEENNNSDREFLLDTGLDIARTLDRVFGGHHPIEVASGERWIEDNRYTRYSIRKLALKGHGNKAFNEIMEKSRSHSLLNREEIDRIKKIIQRDLEGTFGKMLVPFDISHSPRWGTPVMAGKQVYFVVRDIFFEARYRIHGPVYAGSLQSRGFGEIKRAL